MQSSPPECFEREMGCSEADWLRWLPDAIGSHGWSRQGRSAIIELGQSHDAPGQGMAMTPSRPAPTLTLAWQPLPPLAIALLTVPRLRVRFRFEGAGESQRRDFMRRFDLYLQRGGG